MQRTKNVKYLQNECVENYQKCCVTSSLISRILGVMFVLLPPTIVAACSTAA